ncbi:MAG: hypothetical protein SWO11_13905 [Thermodesulfobacteriota bacterium]|nr:hypothetical protein [Thermodesulfobacteriota bacterium]
MKSILIPLQKTIHLLTVISMLLLFHPSILYSQEQGNGGRLRQKGVVSISQTIRGKVHAIDGTMVVVKTRRSHFEKVNLSKKTSYIKESYISKGELKIGERLLVMGNFFEDSFHARLIKVIKKIDAPIKSPKRMGRRFLRKRGGESIDQRRQGPIIGEITGLKPLTIKCDSNEEWIIRITNETKILQENKAEPPEIIKGKDIRIITRFIPHTDEREAIKIIVKPEKDGVLQNRSAPELQAVRDNEGGNGSSNNLAMEDVGDSNLLPDISRVSASNGFVYGIWLGRGLYSNEELDRAFRVAYNFGIKDFMIEFKWGYVEPENDKWNWSNEETIDVEHVIKLARDYNISIIPYFDTFMPWGEIRKLNPDKGECLGPPSRWGQYQAPDPKEYADYAFKVVDKLKRSGVAVRYVALDNEVSNISDGYQSWNCFINATAKQIKEFENAAYNKIKTVYPDIMISSTTFSFPGLPDRLHEDFVKDNMRRNSFVRAYFEDEPKPEFDFLGVHEVLMGSGSPYTIAKKAENADYEFNFGSYNIAYDIWREILDKYGFNNKPIFNLESAAVRKGMQDAQLLQRVVFSRTNAQKNRVMGWVLSQLTVSKRFPKGKGGKRSAIGITALGQGYHLKEGYYAYYTLMTTLARYPRYERRVMGELNTHKPLIEKFRSDISRTLYVAFIPYHGKLEKPVEVSLFIGSSKEGKLTKSDGSSFFLQSNKEGFIRFSIDKKPIFIEVG